MIKKLKMVIALLAVAGAAVVGGCSSGGSSASDFIGDWTLEEISGEEGAGADEIAMLEEMGMAIELTVNEGGKAELSIANESLEGSWSADGKSAVFTFEGDDAQASVAGDKLTLASDDSSMIFRKGKPETSGEPAGPGEEVIEEETVVEE